jgi:hypothetical protein
MLRENGNFPDRSKHSASGSPHRRHHWPDPYLVSPVLNRGAADQVFAPRPRRMLPRINTEARRKFSTRLFARPFMPPRIRHPSSSKFISSQGITSVDLSKNACFPRGPRIRDGWAAWLAGFGHAGAKFVAMIPETATMGVVAVATTCNSLRPDRCRQELNCFVSQKRCFRRGACRSEQIGRQLVILDLLRPT